jgi:hypothetical protein
MKRILIKTTNFLNRNTGFLILVVLIIFGLATIGFQKDNKQLLQSTQTTVKNTQQTAENTEKIIKNLEVAVKDLKDDNARQTRFISCILALHGAGELVEEDVKTQCEVMGSGVDMSDVKPQTAPQVTPTPPQQPEPKNMGQLRKLLQFLKNLGNRR